MFIVALPGLILYSPIYLVRWWRRRRGKDQDPEDAGIFRPTQVSVPVPRPLARASAWFKTEGGQGLLTLIGLAVVLTGSLVAVFGIGVDPIGVLIVAVVLMLAVMGGYKEPGRRPRRRLRPAR